MHIFAVMQFILNCYAVFSYNSNTRHSVAENSAVYLSRQGTMALFVQDSPPRPNIALYENYASRYYLSGRWPCALELSRFGP